MMLLRDLFRMSIGRLAEALPIFAALHAFQEATDGCDFSFGFEEFSISVCELNVAQLPHVKPRSPGDIDQVRCQSVVQMT